MTAETLGDPPAGQSMLCKRKAAAVPKAAPSIWRPSELELFRDAPGDRGEGEA